MGRSLRRERLRLRERPSIRAGFHEGYSTGLLLDQRDNRRRFLTGHIAADFDFGLWTPELWTFELFRLHLRLFGLRRRAGAKTTSLDRLKRYLEWGRRNCVERPRPGDARFHSMATRSTGCGGWRKKGRSFDAVALNRRRFQSKEHGVFRAGKITGNGGRAAAVMPEFCSLDERGRTGAGEISRT